MCPPEVPAEPPLNVSLVSVAGLPVRSEPPLPPNALLTLNVLFTSVKVPPPSTSIPPAVPAPEPLPPPGVPPATLPTNMLRVTVKAGAPSVVPDIEMAPPSPLALDAPAPPLPPAVLVLNVLLSIVKLEPGV